MHIPNDLLLKAALRAGGTRRGRTLRREHEGGVNVARDGVQGRRHDHEHNHNTPFNGYGSWSR